MPIQSTISHLATAVTSSGSTFFSPFNNASNFPSPSLPFSTLSNSLTNTTLTTTSLQSNPNSPISNTSTNSSSIPTKSNGSGGSSSNSPTKKKSENPLAKLLISGGVTIVFEACAGGHYLEMVKIIKQTTGDTYPEITRRMIANKGIVGILDGFMPWGALQACVKGSSFGFGQAAALRLLETVEHIIPMNDSYRMVLSGGLGGFTQGIVMSPMLLLKTRVMTDPRFRTTGGFWSTSLHSLKLGRELVATEGGLMSLTKGMGIFSAKRFADWTTRYGFVVLVENIVKKETGKEKLSKSTQAICALTGGTMSALVTVPIDVLVATVQQASKKGQKVSVIEVYKEALAHGGIKGMVQLSTRGLVARVSHVAMTVLMMKTVSSWIYNVMFHKNDKK